MDDIFGVTTVHSSTNEIAAGCCVADIVRGSKKITFPLIDVPESRS